jgi:histone H4
MGMGGFKRHRKVLGNSLAAISPNDIRRLARKGGVKRLSGLVYEEARGALKAFLKGVIADAITYSTFAHRVTVTCEDVIHALKRRGHTIYGFGC